MRMKSFLVKLQFRDSIFFVKIIFQVVQESHFHREI